MTKDSGFDSPNGEKNNSIIDFTKAKRIKDILNSSNVTPNGEAYIEEFHYPDKTFQVVCLRDHFSKQAINIIDQKLQQEPPAIIIIEGLKESNTPEVKFASQQAKDLSIPAYDVIVSPYNDVIANLAGVSIKSAIQAIIVKELPRYADKPEIITGHLARTFNLTDTSINLMYSQILSEIQINKDSFLKETGETFLKMVSVSNDLSWHKLQELKLKGQVLCVVGGAHSQIFDPDFKPGKIYSDEELKKINSEIFSFESGIKKILTPRSQTESILNTIGNEAFFKEWKALEASLEANPDDEIAKKRLEKLLVPDYEDLMSKDKFRLATQRAESMKKYGLPRATELLSQSLNTDYNNLFSEGLFLYATQRAEKMIKYGIAGGEELLAKARQALKNSRSNQ